jgi:hypothetical protein
MSINLGAIKKKSSAPGKKDLPVLNAADPGGKIAEMADELAQLFDQEKQVTAGKASLQAHFKSLVRPFLFDLNAGRDSVQATTSIQGKNSEILAALKDQYINTETLDEIVLILGEERAQRLFSQVFELKLNSQLIPADCQQIIVDKIVGILGEFGCTDALSAKLVYKPTKAFATERFKTITAEENIALEGINGGAGLTIMSVSPARGRK